MRQTHSVAVAAAEPQEHQETIVEDLEANTTETDSDTETGAMRNWDRMAFPNATAAM